MADVKDEYSPDLVAALAGELHRAWPAFPVTRFKAEAATGLESLALLQRVHHIAAALAGALPANFTKAAAVIDRAVDSPTFTGWMTLPLRLLGSPNTGSANPISPRRCWPDSHPGSPAKARSDRSSKPTPTSPTPTSMNGPATRTNTCAASSPKAPPRLPWISRLRSLIADPTPAIALLDRLVADPSDYVRRSVANHLNDIAKDHPDMALDCARRWQAIGTDRTAWVVRHGLRTLVKRGDPAALTLLGFDHTTPVRLDSLTITPARLPIGGEATIEFTLTTDRTIRVAIDYLIHHAGARGPRGPKVFKLATRTIEPGRPQTITRRHRFREVTVRRLYPGTHRIDIQVNGHVLGGADVKLVDR